MSVNYTKKTAQDVNGIPIYPSYIPASTLGSVNRENASGSSVTTLSEMTTAIEVTAVGTGAGIRWAINQATSVVTIAGTANFDNIVPVNTARLFSIPRNTQAITSVAGINVKEGLFANVATISLGTGSVLIAQY